MNFFKKEIEKKGGQKKQIHHDEVKKKIWIRGVRGVNVRPNLRIRHKPDTGFFGLELGFNGFGS